mmetsp:Transcript_31765/g.57034  ORF Transcript_31765/g.57034 Transcript_31765/m.57034 type:complete len:249 (-) Transcript_31765:1476-2222(-)
MVRASERHQRHSHVHGFARSGRSCVGPAVQGEVQHLVGAQVAVVAGDQPQALDAVVRDPMDREHGSDIPLHTRAGQRLGFDDDPHVGHLLQDAAPCLCHQRCDLGNGVEGAGRDVATGQATQGRDVRGPCVQLLLPLGSDHVRAQWVRPGHPEGHRVRVVAEEAGLQPNKRLGIVLWVGGLYRISNVVREAVVNRRQARRVWVSNPRHLDGGRLACKHVQAVVGSVSCQIDQDIHLCPLHELTDFICG